MDWGGGGGGGLGFADLGVADSPTASPNNVTGCCRNGVEAMEADGN